jgi:hypothetical protein
MLNHHALEKSSKYHQFLKEYPQLFTDLDEKTQALVSGGEFGKIKRLQEEFGAELASLKPFNVPSYRGEID